MTELETLNQEIEQAAQRISPVVRRTPFDQDPFFSKTCGCEVFLKLENLQASGSFKVRGAANAALCLTADQRTKGCVTTSWGNHGAGLAYALKEIGGRGIVYLPEDIHPDRIENIELLGAEVVAKGTDELEIDTRARSQAEKDGMTFISPYNDRQVVCGQGTIAVEMLQDQPDLDVILAAVGGGGLMSGLALHAKAHNPNIEVIGCLPENSPIMAKCVEQGFVSELPYSPTLSDGTVGNIEQDTITFEYCRDYVDDYLLVSEAQIAEAMRIFITRTHMLLEGASGVPLAALLNNSERFAGKKVGIVICGANISLQTLKSIL